MELKVSHLWDKNLGFITKQDIEVENSASIQRYQEKNGNRKIARVDFVSAIWLESDLCDIYYQGQSLLAGKYFKFHHFKENIIYLCNCFPIDSMGHSKI